MRNLSLRFRSFAAAVLTLLIFIPLAVVTLEQAFNSSLLQSMLQQLKAQSLSLISEFEFDQQQPSMPESLYNEQFNLPDSGLYAFVQIDQQLVWRSVSAMNWSTEHPFVVPGVGQESCLVGYFQNEHYFLYTYTAEFASESGYQAVSFIILQDQQVFNSEKARFAATLWKWLSLIALLLLALLLFSLNAALLPISRLNKQIKLAESGQLHRIEQQFPPELDKLKRSINLLLDSEQQQRARYKNSLSDLAHSLKTPLAVLASSDNLPEQAREPIMQIDQLIKRQLKRAVVSSQEGWEQALPLAPVVEKLLNAMTKVYADKQLILDNHGVSTNSFFKGDLTDLMEILGNVLDNACKAAKRRVSVSSTFSSNRLVIEVADDGPGIPADKRQSLLERGARLDSYREGQGIGMAVVSDLLSAYQAQLEISHSQLGGALIRMSFPHS